MKPTRPEMIEFIREQLKTAEGDLKFRASSAMIWRGGTAESWRQVGCNKTKAQRLATSAIHSKIQIKVARRVELFEAVLNELIGTAINVDHSTPSGSNVTLAIRVDQCPSVVKS